MTIQKNQTIYSVDTGKVETVDIYDDPIEFLNSLTLDEIIETSHKLVQGDK